jgi:glycosyltransferase involved in cell wall biosynthesis
MKLIFVTQYFPPEVGAAASRGYDLLQELKSKKHEVLVLTEIPHYPSSVVDEKYKKSMIFREKYNDIDVMRNFVFVSERSNFFQRTALYVSFMFSSVFGSKGIDNVDMVFATSPPLTVGLAGWIISKIKRSKFVIDIRDLWPDSALALGELSEGIITGILKKIELFLYQKADLITIAVPGFRKHISNLKISSKKIIDLPNGANVELFSPASYSNHLREKFGWGGKFLILFSGNHGLAQGLDYLLETADSLREFEDLRFIFIGDGVVKDKLIKKKQKLNLNSVEFLDKVDRDQMPSFISTMDVCLVPLIKHPLFLNALPSKMFEYMACAKPVIVSIEGEAKELIEKSGAGVFVGPENVSQMRDAILSLYKGKLEGGELGKRGREFVNKNYSRIKIAKRFEKILKSIVDI